MVMVTIMAMAMVIFWSIYSLSLDDPQMSRGWTSLVTAYNNYDDYCYSNECLSFVPSTGASLPKPGMETIYNACQDLNPSMPGRPRRDVSWLREQIKDLRKQLTRVYDNYKRSRHCVSLLRHIYIYIYIYILRLLTHLALFIKQVRAARRGESIRRVGEVLREFSLSGVVLHMRLRCLMHIFLCLLRLFIF